MSNPELHDVRKNSGMTSKMGMMIPNPMNETVVVQNCYQHNCVLGKAPSVGLWVLRIHT